METTRPSVLRASRALAWAAPQASAGLGGVQDVDSFSDPDQNIKIRHYTIETACCIPFCNWLSRLLRHGRGRVQPVPRLVLHKLHQPDRRLHSLQPLVGSRERHVPPVW